MKYGLIIVVTLALVSCASKSKAVKSSSQENSKKASLKQNSKAEKSVKIVEEAKVDKKTEEDEQIKVRREKEVKEGEPLAIIEKYTKQLRSFVGVPNSKAKENGIAEQVRQYFDFQELAKLSLGKYWKSESESNRKQFSDLFIQLVENTYLKRSRQIIGNYEVVFKDQKIKGQKASVTSSITQEDADIDIRYDLLKKENQWLIYNITLDDVNLIRTYQSQFNKIISDQGFAHLIALMKKRVAVQDKDDIAL